MAQTKRTRKARQAASRALDKAYAHKAAILKRKGVLSERVNARKKITRGTRTKINKFLDVIEGNAFVVKAPRKVRKQYRESGRLRVSNKVIIAPKEYENQRAGIKRGLVAITRPLGNATEEYLILPFKPTSFPDLVRRLRDDPSLDGLKLPEEFFSFRLGERNSIKSFNNVEEMADYIERNYQHLFKTDDAIKYLTFQRYYLEDWPADDGNPILSEADPTELSFNRPYPKADEKGRSFTRQKRKNQDAFNKRKARSKEKPHERTKRLAANRLRSAQWRQRQFDES